MRNWRQSEAPSTGHRYIMSRKYVWLQRFYFCHMYPHRQVIYLFQDLSLLCEDKKGACSIECFEIKSLAQHLVHSILLNKSHELFLLLYLYKQTWKEMHNIQAGEKKSKL